MEVQIHNIAVKYKLISFIYPVSLEKYRVVYSPLYKQNDKVIVLTELISSNTFCSFGSSQFSINKP